MPEPTGEERRTAIRLPVHLVGTGEALYRRGIEPRAGSADGVNSSAFKVETVNVSVGGLMLTFDVEISNGDVLKMTFIHPETSEELVAEGQIQWMHRNTTDLMGRYCAGVSFRNTPDSIVSSMMDYANRGGGIKGVR